MIPLEIFKRYPKGGFDTEAEAKAWADECAPYLDKSTYFYVEPSGEKFIVVQDLKP